MKIVAKIDSTKVLCEVTTLELANLMGINHTYDDDWRNKSYAEVGQEFNITKIHSTAKFLREVDQSKLKAMSEKLAESLKQVDECRALIESLFLFETLSK